jgi:hypothetical protein
MHREMRDESGQLSVMIIGFALVVVLAIAAITDASAAYLQHSGLDTVADGAALAGAEALNEELVYQQGLGQTPDLDPDLARERVRDYLRQTGAYERFPGLSWDPEISDNQVVVQVSAPLDLPLNVPGAQGVALIRSTGSAVLTTLRN